MTTDPTPSPAGAPIEITDKLIDIYDGGYTPPLAGGCSPAVTRSCSATALENSCPLWPADLESR